MNIHKGKIGRLPATTRDQLNQRMLDGESAATLLPWLNALPVVQALLAARFAGEPVSEQNLSNWRAGGYVQWQKQQERRAIVAELAEDDHSWTPRQPPTKWNSTSACPACSWPILPWPPANF